MPDYAIENDEVARRARVLTLSQSKPKAVVEQPVERRKKKKRKGRRARRALATRAERRIKRFEKQATSVLRDVPPSVISLRRKPRVARREPRLSDYGVKEDRRTNQEILEEFLG